MGTKILLYEAPTYMEYINTAFENPLWHFAKSLTSEMLAVKKKKSCVRLVENFKISLECINTYKISFDVTQIQVFPHSDYVICTLNF